MCLTLYLGTEIEVPLRETAALSVEEVPENLAAVRQWFSLSHVREIGAYTGCSCGFPSAIADTVVEYYEGMRKELDEEELGSVRALLALLRELLAEQRMVELLPVWAGDEFEPPLGTCAWNITTLAPETFLFTEGFLYQVTGEA